MKPYWCTIGDRLAVKWVQAPNLPVRFTTRADAPVSDFDRRGVPLYPSRGQKRLLRATVEQDGAFQERMELLDGLSDGLLDLSPAPRNCATLRLLVLVLVLVGCGVLGFALGCTLALERFAR